MQMIPGSHHDLKDHVDTYGERNILTRGQEVQGVDESRAVPTPLRPGQMSLHSARVIHASRPNRSNDRRIGFVIQSFIPPHVRQTVMEAGAQLVRGTDTDGNFRPLSRPDTDMSPRDLAAKQWVNDVWAEILYKGAARRRDF
jgi:non-heme Fe2+,alpha-ketoglutarate-dependent halogenase